MNKIILQSIVTICLFSVFQVCFSKGKDDSLKVYSLGEITILPKNSPKNISTSNYKVILPLIQSTDVSNASSLRFLLPSTSVRTNSRGETNFFLRGSGERQQAVFFDGMLLNQAYDNRADLSQLPIDVIGGIEVNPMSTSALFGANTMGGVITITTPERSSIGTDYLLRSQIDQNNSYLLSATRFDRSKLFSSAVNVSFLSSNGIAFSGFPDTTYRTNLKETLRDNTDHKRVNLLGRFEFVGHESARIGLTLMNTIEDRGVQNEAHLIPSASRFWRYDNRRRTTAILNAYSGDVIAKTFSLKSTIWLDKSQQTINQYSNGEYTTVTTAQFDQDNTLGVRLLAVQESTFGLFSMSINSMSVHHTEDILTNSTSFKEVTSSFGIQYEKNFSNVVQINAGGNYNINSTQEAGNFTSLNNTSRSLPSYFAKLTYKATDEISLHGTLSKTQRFPAMREALSGALDRFIPNPELLPETGFFQEIGFQYVIKPTLTLNLTAFNNIYENLITQVRLSSQEDSLRRRKRVNVANSIIRGFESSLQYQMKDFQIIGNFSFLDSYSETNGIVDTLENRPTMLGGLVVKSNEILSFFTSQLELDFIGTAFQKNDANIGAFSKILPTTIVNFRIGIPFTIENIQSEFGIRMNNVLNQTRLSQLGIIEPSRNILSTLVVKF